MLPHAPMRSSHFTYRLEFSHNQHKSKQKHQQTHSGAHTNQNQKRVQRGTCYYFTTCGLRAAPCLICFRRVSVVRGAHASNNHHPSLSTHTCYSIKDNSNASSVARACPTPPGVACRASCVWVSANHTNSASASLPRNTWHHCCGHQSHFASFSLLPRTRKQQIHRA